MPRSLNGLGSMEIFVAFTMFGESVALPNRAYLVFEIFVLSPESVQNSSGIRRISFNWVSGLIY